MVTNKSKKIWSIFMICVLALLIVLESYFISYAYDDKYTHKQLTEEAVNKTSLDSFVKNALGYTKGKDAVLPSYTIDGKNVTSDDQPLPLTILNILREGAHLEDVPRCRASNHFHDPTKPWTEAGLEDISLFPKLVGDYCKSWKDWEPFYSNLVWATGYTA